MVGVRSRDPVLTSHWSPQVRKHRACLEICLRQLEVVLDSINQEEIAEEEATKSTFPFAVAPGRAGGAGGQETRVPHPRTSGSRFCSGGLLVCFGRPAFQQQVGCAPLSNT